MGVIHKFCYSPLIDILTMYDQETTTRGDFWTC